MRHRSREIKRRRVFVGILAGLAVLVTVMAAAAGEKRHDVPIGDSPRRGPEDAAVTIVEFLDFQ